MATEGSGVWSVAVLGDRLGTLFALRDRLAAAVDVAKPGELAPLARQLSQVLKDLAELSPMVEVSKVDDLAARRKSRQSGVSDGAVGSV